MSKKRQSQRLKILEETKKRLAQQIEEQSKDNATVKGQISEKRFIATGSKASLDSISVELPKKK